MHVARARGCCDIMNLIKHDPVSCPLGTHLAKHDPVSYPLGTHLWEQLCIDVAVVQPQLLPHKMCCPLGVTCMPQHTGCHLHATTHWVSPACHNKLGVTCMPRHTGCHLHATTHWVSPACHDTLGVTCMPRHTGYHLRQKNTIHHAAMRT